MDGVMDGVMEGVMEGNNEGNIEGDKDGDMECVQVHTVPQTGVIWASIRPMFTLLKVIGRLGLGIGCPIRFGDTPRPGTFFGTQT